MDVIQDIRRSYRVDDGPPSILSNCAEEALKLLSDQLYTKDTHFLLELVQNAEDNEYPNLPGLVPTLRIVTTDSSVIISCNEVGFSEDNVRAICKVGASTKKNNPGFIGEKGIGFKSVFKVADVVHVSSGPYTFKFDRKEHLGMIVPFWDPSSPTEPGWTTFRLSLSRSWSRRESPGAILSQEILKIKPTLVLFLRKLRLIEIDVSTGNGIRRRQSAVRIERRDLDSDFVELIRSENEYLREKQTYFIVKQAIDMSRVPKSARRGADRTELVLAFPVGRDHKPYLSPQDVHAFLPLRKFGFTFVIHGDFLTPSSREDILSDSPWNVCIRDGIVDAFVAAISSFQRNETLRDAWFRYLPTGVIDPFFAPVEESLFREVATMHIVKDAAGVYRLPSQVLNIPSAYRYNGVPLISESFLEHHYLSDDYDSSVDLRILKRLGVRDMTSNDFLSAISKMQPASFESYDTSWHEAVCGELTRLFHLNRSRFNARMRDVRMLPLEGGSWGRIRDAPEFVFEAGVADIPEQIDLRRIHPRIRSSSTPKQYELFHTLGVRDADPTVIGEKILRASGPHSIQAAVANASFFFAYRHQLPSPTGRLPVVDERGVPRLGEEMYLELPEDNGMLRRFLPSSALFIHVAYIQRFLNGSKQKKQWLSWLHDSLLLNTEPRVVDAKLSPEFEEMTRRTCLSDLLIALRYFWPRLSVRLNYDAPWLKALGRISAVAHDGLHCTLDTMYLGRGMIAKYPGITFVPVADPESKDWDFLHAVGVTTKVDVAFFLKLLIHYKNHGASDEKEMKGIYKQLDARFDEDAVKIKNAFREHPLVYVSSNTPSWTYLSDIYWDGPSTISSKVLLRVQYPDLGDLFRDKLELKNAPPDILIHELKSLADEWSGQVITKGVHEKASGLILSISGLFGEGLLASSAVTPVVARHAIFPTRHSPTEVRLQKLGDIYVPDNAGYYADAFRNRIPLLELSDCEQIPKKVENLLHLAPKHVLRSLNDCVVHQMEKRGTPRLNDGLTAEYASKYRAFERIVHDQKPTNQQLESLAKLKEVTIFMVDSISSTLTLHDYPPISTNTDLLQFSEEESSMAFFISNAAYRGPESVHIAICQRLSKMFGCSLDLLVLCATLGTAAFDMVLQLKGVGAVNLRRDEDISWIKPEAGQASSYAKVNCSIRTSSYSQIPPAIFHRAHQHVEGSGEPQNRFSMEELREEVDRISEAFPDFSSASAVRVVRPKHTASVSTRDLSPLRSPSEPKSVILNSMMTSIAEGLGGSMELKGNADTDQKHYSTASVANRPRNSVYQEVNGILGEHYVYNMLSDMIGPSFGPQNWTSTLREFHPGFDRYQGQSLADFTYEDSEGIFTKLLYKDSPHELEEWKGNYPTYHLEVKSTSNGSHEPFHLSKRQFLTALSLNLNNQRLNDRKNIYAIIRVWNVRNPTIDSHAIYLDPIECIANDKLKIVSSTVEFMVGV